MNKLGIWGIAIAVAFVIGALSANPVVEAAGGWKLAFDGLEQQITDLENDSVTQFTVQENTVYTADNTRTRMDVFVSCPDGSFVVKTLQKDSTPSYQTIRSDQPNESLGHGDFNAVRDLNGDDRFGNTETIGLGFFYSKNPIILLQDTTMTVTLLCQPLP